MLGPPSAGPRPDLSPSGCGPRPFARIPFPPKSQPKIMQKSTKKRPKIYLKSTKNQPKMDLLRGLGGLLGGSRGFLGRLETNLRAKMAPRWIWEPSWGGLGGFLGRLEAKLRAKMAPSWVPRRRFWGSKNEAKMDALSGPSWGRHFHGFWIDFGKQNGAKLALKWSATSIEQ